MKTQRFLVHSRAPASGLIESIKVVAIGWTYRFLTSCSDEEVVPYQLQAKFPKLLWSSGLMNAAFNYSGCYANALHVFFLPAMSVFNHVLLGTGLHQLRMLVAITIRFFLHINTQTTIRSFFSHLYADCACSRFQRVYFRFSDDFKKWWSYTNIWLLNSMHP